MEWVGGERERETVSIFHILNSDCPFASKAETLTDCPLEAWDHVEILSYICLRSGLPFMPNADWLWFRNQVKIMG